MQRATSGTPTAAVARRRRRAAATATRATGKGKRADPDDPLPSMKIGRRLLVRASAYDAWASKFTVRVKRREVPEHLRLAYEKGLQVAREYAQTRARDAGSLKGLASSTGWARKRAEMQAAGTWDAFREKRSRIAKEVAARRRAARERGG